MTSHTGKMLPRFVPKYMRLSTGSLSFGRPSKTFDESSDRSKRRRTEDLRKKHSTPELSYAAKMKLRASGKLEEAKLIGEALETTPTWQRR